MIVEFCEWKIEYIKELAKIILYKFGKEHISFITTERIDTEEDLLSYACGLISMSFTYKG